ncbi:MAG: hypothetical protein C5B51_28180 [Terriglobia bacterium]|nr:MAG: hypothetical protein C5B51_28180 [Terriglobia bacterium]
MKFQLTIGKRIGILSAALLMFCMAVGVVALYGFASIDGTMITLTTDAMPGLAASGEIATSISRFRGNTWRHVSASNAEQMAKTEAEMEELKRLIGKQMADYDATIHKADDRANFTALREQLGRYYDAWQNDVLPLSRQGKREEAASAYTRLADPAFQTLDKTMSLIVKWNVDYGNTAATEAIRTVSSTRLWAYCFLGGALLLGSVLAVVILRGVNRTLRVAIAELSSSAGQVAGAASQIASSSQLLAQASSEQASSLEETSASTEEINSMASRNTENSCSAAGLVTQSEQKFAETNQSLEEMVEAMGEIENSSGKISKIIKVIDEIAFQTNILALNAAVEAARAGEAGMGFAVVADEVRNLAQRSAQAAKDTASLIEESIATSNGGKVKVDKVARAIRAVTEDAGKVKTLVDEVNLGSQEQARGIEQIGRALAQMEQVTQTAASNSEQSAAASEELNAQAQALRHIVDGLTALVGAGD